MNTEAINQIQQFISDYQLRKLDGVIAFDAFISTFTKGQLYQYRSDIQIIAIRQILVVYILTAFKDLDLPDMYRTDEAFEFTYHKGKGLEIKGINEGSEFIISITTSF